MNDWLMWLQTGIEHILDLRGYDHMLFVSLLVFTYPVNEWKKLLWLVTAFTIGHSLTLLLSVLDIVKIQQQYTELFIILTIILTAVYLLFTSKNTAKGGRVLYLIICCFGLIHGLGFSYLLKAMLGNSENIIVPLLMFNVGLEVGQIVVVLFMVLVIFLIGKFAKTIEWYFKVGFISSILVIAIILCYSRILNIISE